MQLNVIILAAGQGTRMKSTLPKVLHCVAGKPILQHVIETAQALSPANIYIIYGYQGDIVKSKLSTTGVKWVEQQERLGTGHAVLQALPHVDDPDSRVLILVGDVPLISKETLTDFIARVPADALGMLTAQLPDPTGLGRVIRDANGNMLEIVEHKDATDTQKKINEINTGIILAPTRYLEKWLPLLQNHNNQGEYYLPDIFQQAVKEKIKIVTHTTVAWEEVQGINDRIQLAFIERYYQLHQAKKLMQVGVTLCDPARFDLRGELQAASDVTIDVNVIIEGKVTMGSGTVIGPNCYLRDVTIGENVVIKSNSVIEESTIANDCVIGPFARIRPGTELADTVHIGNFVEIKKSKVGTKTKINHLSYVGDSIIGKKVNVGAGTITCNYDGVDKHQTIIEDEVFIGSDTQLVAPVKIGEGAVIGAGSTITQDVEPRSKTVTHRLEQRVLKDKKK